MPLVSAQRGSYSTTLALLSSIQEQECLLFLIYDLWSSDTAHRAVSLEENEKICPGFRYSLLDSDTGLATV